MNEGDFILNNADFKKAEEMKPMLRDEIDALEFQIQNLETQGIHSVELEEMKKRVEQLKAESAE